MNFRTLTAALAILCLIFTSWGCGRSAQQAASLQKVSFASKEFPEFCRQLNLNCNAPQIPDDPSQTPILPRNPNRQQWGLLVDMARDLMSQEFDLSWNQDELSTVLPHQLRELGFPETASQLEILLEEVEIEGIRQNEGKWEITLEKPGRVVGRSGLIWSMESTISIWVESQKLLVQGVQLSTPNQDLGNIQSVEVVTRKGWDLTTDKQGVTEIPHSFLMWDLGMEQSELNRFAFGHLLPLLAGLLTNPNTIHFKSHFDNALLSRITQKLGQVTPNPSVSLLAAQFPKMINGLSIQTSNIPLVALFRNPTLVSCSVNMDGLPPMELRFENQFQLISLQKKTVNTAQLQLDGIRAKLDTVLGPSFDMDKIEVTPSYLRVHGVPVVGKMDIALNQGQLPKLNKWSCR